MHRRPPHDGRPRCDRGFTPWVLALALCGAAFAIPVQAQSIFASGFEFATAVLRGGSNYHWYALGPDCDREPFGVLANYHEAGVRDTVRAQLIDLRASGQDRISLGLYHLTPTIPTLDGRVTGTVLDSSNGSLQPQYIQNLRELLADVGAAGFEGIMFRFYPQGPNDAKFWSSYSPERVDDNWGVISQVEAELQASGLVYGTDLLVEGMPRADIIQLPGNNDIIRPNDPDNRAWSDYAREIWKRQVQTFGAARTVGFSFVSDINDTRIDARVEHKDYVYTVEGTLVMPVALAIDIYGTPTRDERWIFESYRRHLVDEGLGDMVWLITESYYNDAAAGRALAEAMTATGQTVLYLNQWPLQRGSTCDPNVTVAPPTDYFDFFRFGF